LEAKAAEEEPSCDLAQSRRIPNPFTFVHR